MTVPENPKIYHILHIDRLSSVIEEGFLWCDTKISSNKHKGSTIGMQHIKDRRLNKLLTTHKDLHVGDCVPFYFCPRSVMLFIIHKGNHPQMTYNGGQEPIIHLEGDLYKTVEWAAQQNRRWVFTLSNAGSSYFEDRNNVDQLTEINWGAVETYQWNGTENAMIKDQKQSEFLIEYSFPWENVERIGVHSETILQNVMATIAKSNSRYKPSVEIKPEWYY